MEHRNPSEERRLAALRHLNILDTPREKAFDDVAKLAAQLLAAPIALVSLIERDRQWFKACVGLNASETSREVSFCSHAIAQENLDAVFVVPDAAQDPRFCDNPLVTGPPCIRLYAGAPLVTSDGQPVGSLCVIDIKPGQPTQNQLEALRVLAHSVMAQMELRQSAEDLRESEELNRLIVNTALDAVITVNAERHVMAWNPQAQVIFGVSQAQALGQPLEQLIVPRNSPGNDIASFSSLFAVDHDAHLNHYIEISLKRHDDSAFPAELCISPLRTREGWMFSIFVRDIAQRKREESQRLEAETRDVVIFAMARLAESRDPETGAHIERVQSYCQALSEQLAAAGKYQSLVDPEFIQLMYRASPLHDIGKVGIPDDVLLKPGRLSNREFEIMKTHTSIGAETLEAAMERFANTRFLRMARNIAATHHERFDGTGYPNGLKGEDIPLCGRIVALSDVYDALTSRRIYKPAFTHDVARGIIVRESGKQFDPVIVDAFLATENKFEAIYKHYAETSSVAA
ncbi:MAG: HD domain-containing phosphohydrolase [Tepidisphaeraceae bacterium]